MNVSRPPSFSLTRRAALKAGVALGAGLVLPKAFGKSPLRIGLTPVFLDDQTRFLEGWRTYLEQAMARPVQFIQRRTYREVVRLLLEGESDFAWLCGFPYWRYREQLKLVAVPIYRGRPFYRAYLIRHAEHTDLHGIGCLRSRPFAYSDPDSNSGFLYVQHRLRSLGFEPHTFFGRSFFTWAHRQVVEAVSVQLAHAGAVDGYVWDVLSQHRPPLTERTEILETSPEFGFPPIVATHAVDAQTLSGLQRTLQTMHHTPEGHALLATLALDGFEGASPLLYQSIGEMTNDL